MVWTVITRLPDGSPGKGWDFDSLALAWAHLDSLENVTAELITREEFDREIIRELEKKYGLAFGNGISGGI